jgi:excisionase family DNA binding protein
MKFEDEFKDLPSIEDVFKDIPTFEELEDKLKDLPSPGELKDELKDIPELKSRGGEDVRTPEVMDIRGAADYLSLGVGTVYKLAHDGKIPAVKIAGQWRFPKAALDEWLTSKAFKGMFSPEVRRQKSEGK